jgi:hypothetical protein
MKNKIHNSIRVMLLFSFFFFLPLSVTAHQAISYFNKAIKANPRYYEAYTARGLAYSLKGQFDQAIADYSKALEIEPRGVWAYAGRGSVYMKGKGQYDQAISDFNKCIEIDPKFADAYYFRGIAYYFKREYAKSWEDINKAQSLGAEISQGFLEDLRKASGIQKSAEKTREENLNELFNKMRMFCLQTYDFGYKTGICDPDAAGIKPQDDFYGVLILHQPWCVIGAQDKQKGIPYDRDKILKLIDEAIASGKKQIKNK